MNPLKMAIFMFTLKEGKNLKIAGKSLTCYSDIEANQGKFCDENDRFNTCFSTYDRSNLTLFFMKLDIVFFIFRWKSYIERMFYYK